MVAALTVLPAILLLLGRRIDAGRLPWRRHRPVAVDNDHGVWARLATGVMRRPVVVMVVVVGALLVVASPFLGAKWGSVDYRVLPPDSPAHVAAVTLNEDFGQERSTANIAARDRRTRPRWRRTPTRSSRSTACSTYARSTQQDGVTLLRASWAGNSQTQASQDDGRGDPRRSPARAVTDVLVGGLTADTVDLLTSLESPTCRGWRRSSPW